MGFSKKVLYFLVHSAGFTNAEAKKSLLNGEVALDGITVYENCVLNGNEEIRLKGEILRAAKKHVYLKFYKPRAYQSSLNRSVSNNIRHFFEEAEQLAVAGRLDKESEGLLVLSNDGKWIEELCNPLSEKEKEYLVSLDKIPSLEFLESFRSGVRIGSYQTKACRCEWLGENTIRVVLTEGKNRQIRRMAYQLGYQVIQLKRVRIDAVSLGNLAPGEFEEFKV